MMRATAAMPRLCPMSAEDSHMIILCISCVYIYIYIHTYIHIHYIYIEREGEIHTYIHIHIYMPAGIDRIIGD